jgi:hypothetical protein
VESRLVRMRLGIEYEPRLRVEIDPPYEALGWLFDARIWSADGLGDLLRVAAEVRAGTRAPYESYSDGLAFTITRDEVVIAGQYDDSVVHVPLALFEEVVRRLQRFLESGQERAEEQL